MNKLRDFIGSIPVLCGAKNAERWRAINLYVYDHELANKVSPFARNRDDIENPENRMSVLFGFLSENKEYSSAEIDQCKRLFRLAELSHYKNEHGDNSNNAEIESLTLAAVNAESDTPTVADVFTVDDALAVAGWNG